MMLVIIMSCLLLRMSYEGQWRSIIFICQELTNGFKLTRVFLWPQTIYAFVSLLSSSLASFVEQFVLWQRFLKKKAKYIV